MKRFPKNGSRLAVIGLLVFALAGCAVVPYDPPGYYGYGGPVYAPVPVPVPVYRPWHHHHHHHR